MIDLQGQRHEIEVQINADLDEQKRVDESIVAGLRAVEHHVREAREILYRIEREKLSSGLSARYAHLLKVLAEIDGKVAAQQRIVDQRKHLTGISSTGEAVADRTQGRARTRQKRCEECSG